MAAVEHGLDGVEAVENSVVAVGGEGTEIDRDCSADGRTLNLCLVLWHERLIESSAIRLVLVLRL